MVCSPIGNKCFVATSQNLRVEWSSHGLLPFCSRVIQMVRLSAVIQDWLVEGKHLFLSSEAVALWPRCIKNTPMACALLTLAVLEWSSEISVLLENLILAWTRP